MPSQNVTFDGEAPPLGDPEVAEPEGASILRAMKSDLVTAGWRVGELDIFHGCWGVPVHRGNAELLLVITGALVPGGSPWFLQISYETAGFISRLFGKADAASPLVCEALAQAVHDCLNRRGFTNMRWRWNGPPTEVEYSPTPRVP